MVSPLSLDTAFLEHLFLLASLSLDIFSSWNPFLVPSFSWNLFLLTALLLTHFSLEIVLLTSLFLDISWSWDLFLWKHVSLDISFSLQLFPSASRCHGIALSGYLFLVTAPFSWCLFLLVSLSLDVPFSQPAARSRGILVLSIILPSPFCEMSFSWYLFLLTSLVLRKFSELLWHLKSKSNRTLTGHRNSTAMSNHWIPKHKPSSTQSQVKNSHKWSWLSKSDPLGNHWIAKHASTSAKRHIQSHPGTTQRRTSKVSLAQQSNCAEQHWIANHSEAACASAAKEHGRGHCNVIYKSTNLADKTQWQRCPKS